MTSDDICVRDYVAEEAEAKVAALGFLDELRERGVDRSEYEGTWAPRISGSEYADPAVGATATWNGSAWVPTVAAPGSVGPAPGYVSPAARIRSVSFPEVTAPRGGITYGDPEVSKKPLYPHPEEPVIPESEDAGDPLLEELCEVLLCTECDMELGAIACGPRHAYLADHPMEHRLLAPRLAEYLAEVRREDVRCTICNDGRTLATGDCLHVDVRADQIRMSRKEWMEMGSVLDFYKDKLDEVDEALKNPDPVTYDLIWHAERAATVDFASKRWWDDVAEEILERLRRRVKL